MERLLVIQNGVADLLRLTFDEILYIRSDGDYCTLVLSNDTEIQLWMNLKKVSEIIDLQMHEVQPVFVRVGKQYVLNIRYIYRIDTKKDQLSLWRKEMGMPVQLGGISHKALVALDGSLENNEYGIYRR